MWYQVLLGFGRERRSSMDRSDKNVDYCGIIILLRQLIAAGHCTKAEGQKIAARIAVAYDINIIYPL